MGSEAVAEFLRGHKKKDRKASKDSRHSSRRSSKKKKKKRSSRRSSKRAARRRLKMSTARVGVRVTSTWRTLTQGIGKKCLSRLWSNFFLMLSVNDNRSIVV